MVLTVEQVSERLSLTPRHIRDLIREGIIPGFRRGKRVWGVLLAELEKWLEARQRPTPKP